ncbi:LPS export ABC transporter periplasmic protein LptC [Acuticoccus sp. MNP-M23]|uniref:LPS export ABC transporter periplasmic protein LptC n=1 Tax=Acuticoccus sp. MNP-M23 TaxID=3072793 RepID=UPI002815EC36|nr:LPS export ABC transporter periplasmic protein LptC [Acuticoccus sp. MNP-M23]WMS43758.1 LPS export ABC transporter periplasmic protein LptC [Acuticoccus sp. MNP-M23]
MGKAAISAAAAVHGGEALPPARRVVEQRRARSNSRRVRRLRVFLPVVAALIAVVLVGAAVLPKLFPLAALAGLSLTADGLVMNEPRLAGHLGGGRRYEVVAERAIQSLLNPSRLTLEGLTANLDMGEGQEVVINGNTAAYNTDTEILDLTDGVSLASSDGSTISLPAATVDLRAGSVDADGGIEIDSPRGHVTAGGISVTNGGTFIRLTGGVSIMINPSN